MNIPTSSIRPGAVARFLFAFMALLLVANLIGLFCTYILGDDFFYGFVPLFDFDRERNAPTLFTTCLFLLGSILFLIAWKASRDSGEQRLAWLLLAAVFSFLGLDEFSAIHEMTSIPVRSALDTSGVFHFAWVIPYGIGVVLLALYVLPTLWRLQRGLKFWFVLSAVIFLVGALGFEMIGGLYFDRLDETPNLLYGVITTVEETLEMSGLIVLTYALLLLLEREYGGFVLKIEASSGLPPSANNP